jgi:4-amino-4-deoxy-L-arabinose transferase-like glycosyltransferase
MNKLLRPFERLSDALADPHRSHRTAAALIAAYTLAWWIYALIAKSSQDIHFDMGEVVSWSLVPAFGYPKHPPFPAWVAAVWFAVFPYRDWAYYLLSAAGIGVALWFVWLIAARHVEGGKRVLALTFLTFSPGFNFQPLKFNSNALLIPVWAAASYLFLRAFHERTFGWGALAGAAAAAAMLTKYWSIFLILAFVVAALVHPRRWDYLRSPAPWASVAVGALLFAPNVVSLLDYDFQPFRYAASSHGVLTLGVLFASFGDYFGGVLYLAGGVAVLALACRPGSAAVRDMLLPAEPDRRLMLTVTAVVLLAPIPLALVMETRLATLWTLPMWAMLPALLMSSRALSLGREAAARVLAAAAVVPAAAILLAPAIAYAIHLQGSSNHASHYRLIAEAVDAAWRGRTAAPLRLLGSNTNIVNGAAFYLPSQPLRIDILGTRDTPWADETQIARNGIALVCPEAQSECMNQLNARAARLPRDIVTLSRVFFGAADAPARYVIVIVPPRA